MSDKLTVQVLPRTGDAVCVVTKDDGTTSKVHVWPRDATTVDEIKEAARRYVLAA